MKKIISYLGLIAAGLLLAGGVQAQSGELSYSYIEGGLTVIDVDNGGSEEGFNLRTSIDLTNGLYLIGSFDNVDELDLYKVGLGFRAPVNSTTDWFVEGSYFKADSPIGDADDARLDIGVRSALNNNIEGRVFAGFLFPDSDEYLVGGDLLFKVSDVFGVSVGAETIEFDVHTFRANLRFSF